MSDPSICRDVLVNGVRFVTERMPHVRSVSIGVWLSRGSRHEPSTHAGIAHFVEHMLFKGTDRRTAESIAQEVDSIGGQLDAFTSKEYAGYYMKVLDEHLPVAVDVLADLVSHPTFDSVEIEKEQKVVLEEIKMVEDTPDDLVHELFAEGFWPDHPLGRPILGIPSSVSALDKDALRAFFADTYVAPNMSVVAVGNLDHEAVKRLMETALADVPLRGLPVDVRPPTVAQNTLVRRKELEQSHICLGMPALAQSDPDRYVSYALNTVLGGSMSSRLFQNVREKRGLAYAVFSGLSAYTDSGALSIYAGCANDAVSELIDVVVGELRQMRDERVGEVELRRAKDHLKGSLMLNLESTSSRMSHLARQEIYRDRTDTLDEMLAAIERVTVDDVHRLSELFFAKGTLGVTVLGNVNGLEVTREQLAV
ncbi:MAG TPA: pitrilysin family protein [Vicinamibacterales bacterium]|nr:pitrilysin family protein [Vicinamibacterales bacterium]